MSGEEGDSSQMLGEGESFLAIGGTIMLTLIICCIVEKKRKKEIVIDAFFPHGI